MSTMAKAASMEPSFSYRVTYIPTSQCNFLPLNPRMTNRAHNSSDIHYISLPFPSPARVTMHDPKRYPTNHGLRVNLSPPFQAYLPSALHPQLQDRRQ